MAHIEMSQIKAVHSALAEPLRVRIVCLLLARELCVCEIMRVVGQPQYKVSRHLTVLKSAGLLRGWREGTWIHYGLNSSLSVEWKKALKGLSCVWDKNAIIQEDKRRLNSTPVLRSRTQKNCA